MFSKRVLTVIAGVAYLASVSLDSLASHTEYRKGLEESNKGVYDSGLQQDWLAYSAMQRHHLTSWQLLNPWHVTYLSLVERPPEMRVKTNADGSLEWALIEHKKKAKVSLHITWAEENK